MLLQAGQLASAAGTQLTTVAFPLLVLALTGSAALAGLVVFVRFLAPVLFTIPFGALADSTDRRRMMVVADVIRASAVGAIAASVAAGDPPVALIAALAFIEGTGSAMYSGASPGALSATVAKDQLPSAIAAVTGRTAVIQVAGPPVGGAAFAVARALPFAVDALSYAASLVSLLLVRRRFQPEHPSVAGPLPGRLAGGFRFAWRQRFIRDTALMIGSANMILTALSFALVVAARRDGWSPGEIGLLVGTFGACVFLGSLLTGAIRRMLPLGVVMLLESWAYVALVVVLVWPEPLVLGVAMLPAALAIPSTDSVVMAHRIAVTPGEMLGRSESVARLFTTALMPLGPLVAGLLLSNASPRVALAPFVTCGVVLAVLATTSRSIRGVREIGHVEVRLH
jgi:MFS family permease